MFANATIDLSPYRLARLDFSHGTDADNWLTLAPLIAVQWVLSSGSISTVSGTLEESLH